jgi:pyruvate/2-oxoglutarate/acetoin dehydrogenase E1 component
VSETAVKAPGLTLREAVLEGIREEMRRDSNVIVIGQDLRAFEGPLKSTEGLWEEFGDQRIIETPICESSATSMGVGAAVMGMRPIVEIMFSDLLPVAATPLIQLAANLRFMTAGVGRVPMVIRTRGGDGPYRAHPQNYEALFTHSPGMTVVVPSNARDGKGLMQSAIRSDDPVLFIENIFLYNAYRQPVGDAELVPLGKAAVARPGRDVTVVTYGRGVRTSQTAAERLAADGIEVEVLDLRTVAPLDDEAIMESVGRTGRLVVVHEAWKTGGIGAEILSRVAQHGSERLQAPPLLVGAPDVPVPWAEPLRDSMLPTPTGIADAVRGLVRDGGSP